MSTGHTTFEPLGDHDRSAFSCGSETLDRYLRERAGQEQQRSVASCFVLVDRDTLAIVGYYTLSATAIVAKDLPRDLARRLPRYPNLPGILLGRLAVDARYQGQGFGRRLLVDALRRACDVTDQVAAVAVVVDAKDDAAAPFYESFGFTRFADEPLRLFLPIATIRALSRQLNAGAGPGGRPGALACPYSTVTLFARLRGWSTSRPRATATW